MSTTLRRTARRLGVLAAAAGLAAGAFVIVSSGGTSGASSSAPTLDHFLCYPSKVAGFKGVPGNLQLLNVLQPTPFTPRVGVANVHCNPANKSIPGAIFVAKDPLAHLLCWSIAYKIANQTVLLTNQFGKATMTTGSPGHLCLPSWKSNIAPPNMPTDAPPGLDHFTCYPLTAIASDYGFKVTGVKAEDEFSAPKYTALKLGIADSVCVPTTKIVNGIAYPPQSANDLSLVCFPTSPTPIWKLVYDQNQFGTGPVAPTTKLEGFCAPSNVTVQKPVSS